MLYTLNLYNILFWLYLKKVEEIRKERCPCLFGFIHQEFSLFHSELEGMRKAGGLSLPPVKYCIPHLGAEGALFGHTCPEWNFHQAEVLVS